MKKRCPLCNGATVAGPDEFLTCNRCCELLRPTELVRRATRWTRRAYCRLNFGTNTYPA